MMESILDILKITFDKVKEDFNGITDKYMKVDGEKEKRMDLVYGKVIMEIAMKDNGSMEGKMELELINIEQVHIKDSSKIVLNMEMVNSFLPMVTIIKDFMKKENPMELEDMIGVMEVIMKVILLMAIAMAKESSMRKMVFITKVKPLIS